MADQLTLDPAAPLLANGYTLAHLCDAAYSDDPVTHVSFCKTVFTSLWPFAQGNTAGFVTANADHVVVAFRGTDDFNDVLTDGDVRLVDRTADLGGKVHRGFLEALDSIWDDVLARLEAARNNQQLIWVCGHSLGGALACLACRRLPDDLKPFMGFSYGQPRTGDLEFARNFHCPFQRFVNNRDIVPTVPPRLAIAFPPAFYTHIPLLQFFDQNGKWITGLTSGEELGAAPILHELLGPLSEEEEKAADLVREGLQDHKIANYIHVIGDNLPAS